MLKEDVNKLRTADIYSLVLFAIFQLKKAPEYAVLSELIYSVDRDSLLNLCKQFGGMTISIPTLEDLEDVLSALLLFCYVDLEHKSVEESLQLLHCSKERSSSLLRIYNTLQATLLEFDFGREHGL